LAYARTSDEVRRSVSGDRADDITERAESTLRAELAEERRREAAERERDDLRRQLEARREPPRGPQESPVASASTQEPPAVVRAGAQEAREATRSAAETLRVPSERRPPTGGIQQSLQRLAQPGLRGQLWRRVFGR
jgi:hypothetical protein